MADTDYIFHISPYDTEKLLPQVRGRSKKGRKWFRGNDFPGYGSIPTDSALWRGGGKGAGYAQGE